MRIAPRHHRHVTPLGLELGPAVGEAEEVLGIVDLNCISIRNPAYGVSEGMVIEEHW